MKYKLLAFDIDGTLLNSKKELTPATKDAITKAMEQGVKVAIASGRPVQGIRKLAAELKLAEYGGYILALNGGLVISCADDAVIHDVKLPKEYYKEIYDLSKEYKVDLITYEGNDVITENFENEYLDIEARINGLGKKKVDNLYERLTFEVNKFLMLGDGDYLAEVEKKVYEQLHDRLDVYRSEPFFLEIMPKGIHKANALHKMSEVIGISKEEMVAFGDGFNDLSMIQYAGLGVAMGNAKDVVKENADFIAKTNDEDGIVEVLEKFVLD